MAWQKMAVLAVAGVLCMSALLNGAGASVTATNPPLRNATQTSGCGNFTASCNEISVSGSILSATCVFGYKTTKFSKIDLNLFLSNINGILEPGSGYMATCTPTGGRQQGSSFFIFARCRQKNGNEIVTFFDVNENVVNLYGTLEWFNCDELLAMDEIAAADEEVALSGRKLLNH